MAEWVCRVCGGQLQYALMKMFDDTCGRCDTCGGTRRMVKVEDENTSDDAFDYDVATTDRAAAKKRAEKVKPKCPVCGEETRVWICGVCPKCWEKGAYE